MALSKQQLCAGMTRTRLNLEEKIKILNYSNEHQKKVIGKQMPSFKLVKQLHHLY